MVRMSSLILTNKRSPFVPIEFYRDTPAHAGVFMRSEDTLSCFFSEPSGTRASPRRRESGRELFVPYSRMIL